MSLKINCPSCGQSLKIKESLAGKTVPCPACKTPFTIPIEPQSSGPASLEPAGNSQAEPAAKPSQVRSQIGRFQIRAALGQGGFGTVYRAYDPILDREVALKVPRFDRRAAERLIVEARTAAPLRHPNIVAVYEAGADGDDLFIAAEYVKGQTLADRISAGNFDSQLAAAWVQSLADGLHYAHTESVIHRDVKPQNIMLGAQDRPQLMDFGLAVSDATKAESPSDGQEVAGTPAYMPPEQARGENQAISAASDQYSLGAVLYELLTGHPPFRGGKDVVEKIGAGEQPPAIRSVNKAVPRDLEAICRKAMAPRPEKRYSSCKALSEDLGRFLNGELVRARWYSPIELAVYWAKKRPALFGWAAAAVCLLALLLGGGIAWTINAMGKEAPAVVAETPVVPEIVPETPDEPEDIRSTRFDVTSTVEAETILYGRQLDRTREAFAASDVTLADRLLEESRWDFRGWEYNYLRRIVAGGWKTLDGHSGQITALAVHPDGGQCVSAGLDGTLRVWNLTTGEPVQTLSCSHRVTSLCYSPDGRLLALATGTDSARSVIDAFDEKLSGDASRFGGPATAQLQFAPDAHPVILLNALTLDRVAVYTEHRGPISCVAFSADGRHIVSSGSQMPEGAQPGQPLAGTARLWNIETLKTERELASPSGPIHRIAFAADPQKIVGTTGGTYGGSVVVWNLVSLAEPSTVNPLPPVAVPVPAAAPAAQEFTAAQALPAAEVLPVAEAAPAAAAAVPPTAVAPVAEAAPAPVAPVPADQQAPPAAPVVPAVAALQPLMPEQQLSSAEFALAMNPSMPGQLLSSPEMGLWLLEQNRRRVRGDFEALHEWNPASYETPRELHSELLATFDAAFAPDKNDYWLHSLATAGGDPLQIYRPGSLMLRNPSYQRDGLIAHRGHRAALTAVAFRPDGKQFVTGDVTGALKVWNAEVHPEAITLPSQPAATRVAFGKDGRYVAVAGRSHSWETRRGAITRFDFQNRPLPPDPATPGTIQIHDITNGRQLLTLAGGPGDILGMAMDPQSRFIAAGGADQHVRVWNLDNGAVVHEWPTPGVVKCVAVSTDGRLIAACCQAAPAAPAPQPANQANGPANPEGFVLIYDAGNGQEIARWAAHRGDALSVAFSSDGQKIASSGADGEVKVWNLENQQLINTMESIDGQIVDLAFRPGSNELAGVGFNPCCNDKPGEVAVWNTTDGRRRLSVTRRTGRHYGITFSPDGQRFATCGGAYEGSLATPGDVAVWDSETGIELLPLAGPSGRMRATSEESYTVMINQRRTVSVPETQTVEKQVSVPKEVVYEVTVTKTGDDGKPMTVVEKRTRTEMETQTRTELMEVMVQKDVTVCVPETRTRTVSIMEETPGTVLSVAFSRDGRSLAAACEDGSAMVWDAENCDPEFTYRWPNGRMLCTATSPDGSLIATAGDSGNACKPQGLVRLVDSQTGRLARELTTSTGSITEIGFLPDGGQVVIATDVSEWDLPNPERTEPPVPAALKTPAQIAALREQQTEKAGCEIWNLVTGERVREIDGIQQRIDGLQIHPVNGNIVLASGQVVRMLDSTTGDEVKRWEVNQPIESLALSNDGTSFAVSTTNGKLFRGRFYHDSPLIAISEQISASELVFDSVGERLFAVERAHAIPETPADTIVAPQECLVTLKRTTPAGHQMHIFGSDPSQPAAVFPLEFASAIQRLEFNGEQNALTVFGNDDQILVDADTGEVRPSPRPESEDASAVVPKSGPLASIRHERKLIVEQPNHIGADPDQCAACEPPRTRTVTLSSDPRYRLHEAQFSRDGKVAMLSAIHEIPIPFRNFRYHLQRNDTNTGKRLILGGHNLPIRALAVRPGSDQIASAGDEQLLSVWDGKGERIQVTQQAGKVSMLQYSPDGKMLLSAAEGIGEVAIWDADTLQEIRRIAAEPSTVFAAAIDPSGKQMVTGGASGAVKVWNIETGELIREWPAHEGRINALQISHNGQMIATGGEDTIVTLWKWETGDVQHRTDKVDAAIGDVAFNADDSILAIGGATPKVRLLKTETGRFLSPLEDHPVPITSVEFSPDGAQLACCGPDAPLVIWDWKEGERLSTVPTAGTCVSWLSEGGHTVSATVNNAPAPAPAPEYEAVFTVNDVASGAIVEQFQIPDVSNGVFDLSPDGRFVVVARPDGVVLLWDRDSDTVVAECSGHQGVVRGLAFHPDGQQFVTTGEDATVRLWSIAGKELEVFKQPSGCSCIAFSPDGELIAVGMQRTVALWSLARKKLVRTFDGNYGELWNIEFDPTGASLAATSHILFDNKWVSDLKIWNVQTGDRLLSTRFKVNYGPQFSFHPTMPYVAVVGSNHQLLVLNSESGKQMLRVPSRATTQFVQYSPDGTKLLAWIDGLPKIVDATPEEVPFGTATVPPREQVAAEAEAARWVLKHGGQIQVLIDHVAPLDVNRAEDLPTEPYSVCRVILSGNDKIDDKDLEILQPLRHLISVRLELPKVTNAGIGFLRENKNLQEVFLSGTRISDKGLEVLSKLDRLRVLETNGTQITGTGLSLYLGNCRTLETLNVYHCNIDDSSMPTILKFSSLRYLGLTGTKVSSAVVDEARRTHPAIGITF